MNYQVRVIDDDQLPPETAWAFVRAGGEEFMFVKRSTVTLTSRADLVVLVESVTGAPCPCERGMICPLLERQVVARAV